MPLEINIADVENVSNGAGASHGHHVGVLRSIEEAQLDSECVLTSVFDVLFVLLRVVVVLKPTENLLGYRLVCYQDDQTNDGAGAHGQSVCVVEHGNAERLTLRSGTIEVQTIKWLDSEILAGLHAPTVRFAFGETSAPDLKALDKLAGQLGSMCAGRVAST